MRILLTHAGHERAFNHRQLAYKILATTGPTDMENRVRRPQEKYFLQGRRSVFYDYFLRPSIATAVIAGSAPVKPNVVTDGGLKHAGKGLAFGTFGTWEPGREWVQITPEELSFARPIWEGYMQRPSGILLAGIIPGVFNSSTRAELAGLISALAKPVALHIALDNASVANRARAIAEGSYTHRKPWRLRPDGDLWAIVANLIQARGPKTTRVSWTKGHAGWHWIAMQSDNATTVANGQADLAAGKGEAVTGAGGEGTALDYHARKIKAYEGLVARLQVHAAQLIGEDKRRRADMGIANEGSDSPFVS
jgi:hypothetical protein